MPELLLRLATFEWNGIPVASLALFAFGGLVYLAMGRTPTAAPARSLSVRRPGWIARRRARAGIAHRRGRVGVGYTSATRSVHLTARELTGHGFVVGGPGSGKTTFLQLLVEASAGRVPIVVVDPKGSPALEQTVRAHNGAVWTLDGKQAADLLDPRPWQVPDLLLEAEDYSANARVYRDAAHQRALWAAWALALDNRPMDLGELRRLLDRAELMRALKRHVDRDERIADWLHHLAHQHGGVEDSGARGLDRALGVLLDGVAIRGSLRVCPEALRLDDVIQTGGLALFKLDAAEYPHATRKVASWVLLGMSRVSRQISPMGETPAALLLVDEVGALGHSARHLRGLVGRARESGLAVVLATQGPSDLEAVDRALLPQVLQDTAWQLAFRQGSPQDAERMQAVFGQAWVEDLTRWSDGRSSSRRVERPRVPIDEWMNDLQPGDAWLRVAPVDQGWRQERVRVALPRHREPPRPRIPYVSRQRRLPAPGAAANAGREPTHAPSGVDNVVVGPTLTGTYGHRRGYRSTGTVPTADASSAGATVEQRFLQDEDAAAAFWARVMPHDRHRLYWTGPRDRKGYGRVRWKGLELKAHRVVWTSEVGPIPDGDEWTIDHRCPDAIDKACCTPEHEQLVQRPRNTQLRWERAQTQAPAVGTCFAIALFERIGKPEVSSRVVSLDELVELLGRFEILGDKRRGRCWSPTKYADGASSRGNAGVESVSCLVFDLDRVPPDPARLERICWLGHTTWSHTPSAPRWRVVIPLASPVAASAWGDIWRRARAALCPEADPVCKDPGRAYWLPSCPRGAATETNHHPGPLLDARGLPELPKTDRPAQGRAPLRRGSLDGGDRRRAEAYMGQVLDNLAAAAPGGRNAALNRAAWTLGRWVAAGALEQSQVEDGLYAAAERSGLVADDGDRQCWATIRSGLSAGLQQPVEMDSM